MRQLIGIVGTVAGLALAVFAWQARTQPERDSRGTSIKPIRAIGAIQPRISPDGKQIAVSYQGAIWTMPRDGGTLSRLTEGTGFDIAPAWSPDGKRIAFVNSPSMYGGRLQVINARDGSPVKLPRPINAVGTIVYQKLDFHPDGNRILGVFRSGGKNHGLSWYDLKTGKITSVVNLKRWSRFGLSHDGKTVVYTTTMNVIGQQGGNDGQQADIWRVPATGGKPVKIVRFPSRVHDLCFSADDRSLIVVTELGGVHYDLWRFDLSDPARSKRKLTFGQADEDRPSVSRNGRWLVHTDNHEGATAVVVRDLRDGSSKTLTVTRLDYRKPVGQLRIALRDKATGKPVTGRVSIERKGGKFVAPVGALYRVLKSDSHFYCVGAAELPLPAGEYRVKVYRGPEYRVKYRDIIIPVDKRLDVTVTLERWANNAKRGWYSGENHIHANYGYGEWYNSPATMLQQCSGENLNVCNFMVANSDTDGVFDREYFRGKPDALSTPETILYWNQEFRSTIWGHMTLVNLKQVVEPVFTGFQGTTNPRDIPTNADVAEKTHLQNGHVNYTHVAQNPDDPYRNPYTGKGIPIDVALGKTDTLDLNGSYRGTIPLWYQLLNCGFRLPASAGTDCFLNRIRSRVPGGDRVYVQVEGGLAYSNWIAGLKAGRSFVTNGPMLELQAGGQPIGGTVRLPGPGRIRVKARAAAQFPLNKVELIANGKVVVTAKLSKDKLTASFDGRVEMPTSGWIALRASGPNHADLPTFGQYAHTSPIYVEVKGKPYDARKEAASFLKWIDRLELAVRVRDRIPGEKNKRRVRDQFEAARRVYRKLANR